MIEAAAFLICIRFFVVSICTVMLYSQSGPNGCPPLARVAIPDIEITSATLTPAGPAGRDGSVVPEHCLVRGAIDRRTGFGDNSYTIDFELKLPVKYFEESIPGPKRASLNFSAGNTDGQQLLRGVTRPFNSLSVPWPVRAATQSRRPWL